MAEHHPVFSNFEPWSGEVDPIFQVDFLGVKTRLTYCRFPGTPPLPTDSTPVRREAGFPDFHNEYFEWIDVLESVKNASGQFVMIELGAGWGRWLSIAYGALRRLCPDMPYRLVGVEAEPTHFKWLSEHLQDNGIDLSRCDLIEAAVTDRDGMVGFAAGNPDTSYGQRVGGQTPVKSVSLRTIMKAYDRIDLIDMDIQGEEYLVLSRAVQDVHKKVKRIHIGTHNRKVEEGLRAGFTRLGWKKIWDFPCHAESETPYGKIEFQDGVQAWLNPTLA